MLQQNDPYLNRGGLEIYENTRRKFSLKPICAHDVFGGTLQSEAIISCIYLMIQWTSSPLPTLASYPKIKDPYIIFWNHEKPLRKKIMKHENAWKSKPQTTVHLSVSNKYVKII